MNDTSKGFSQPVLAYETPAPSAPLKLDRSLIRSQLLVWVAAAFTIAYCQIGIRLAQNYEHSNVLCAAATGTDRYDFWLSEFPIVGLMVYLIAIALLAVVMVILRRWTPACIWAVGSAVFAWFMFMGVCFTIMDDAFP